MFSQELFLLPLHVLFPLLPADNSAFLPSRALFAQKSQLYFLPMYWSFRFLLNQSESTLALALLHGVQKDCSIKATGRGKVTFLERHIPW